MLHLFLLLFLSFFLPFFTYFSLYLHQFNGCLFVLIPEHDSKRSKHWHPVHAGDMEVFFALHIAMGLVHKPALRNYWSMDLVTQTPFLGEYMSLNAFELISQKLHFDNDLLNPRPGEPGHDPLAKIRHIVSTLQNSFRSSLVPNHALGLDEATYAFHGVCRFCAFNKNKPDKYHLKLYAVSEADSGYCLGFEVSTGAERRDKVTKKLEWEGVLPLIQKRYDIPHTSMLKFGKCPNRGVDPQKMTFNSETVMQMMHKFCLLDQGYHLYMDNFYSSPVLATALLARSTGFRRTVRSNKTDWPITLGKASKQIQPRSKEICWRHSENAQMLAMTIGDRKVFHLISMIHNATMTQVHIPSEGKWDWCANAVLNYNYSMKAVDLGDKILKSYEMNRKTLLWTTKLVFHLANMAMMNAYLLMCRSQQAAREGIIMQGHVQNLPRLCEDLKLHNHFTFRVNVILALVEECNQDHTFCNLCVRVLALAPERCFNKRHFPEEIIPMKEGANNYQHCNACYTEKGGSAPKFNVALARNSCAPGRALWCTTPKASHMWMQSRHGMTN